MELLCQARQWRAGTDLALLRPFGCHLPADRKRELILQHWRNHKAGIVAIAFFNPLAYILVLYALTFTPVAYVAPIREVGVLFTVIAGSLLLNEGKLKQRLSWAAVILAGTVLLVLA